MLRRVVTVSSKTFKGLILFNIYLCSFCNVIFFNFIAPVARKFSAVPVAAVKPSSDVVIPDLVESLEWVLDSPPNIHQFNEPPVSYILSMCHILFNFMLI